MKRFSAVLSLVIVSIIFFAQSAIAGGGDLPPLAITKTCPATARPGEVINCTIKISNSTKEDYWEVQLTEVLPASLTFINNGLPGECKVKGGKPECSFSPLNKYSDKTYNFSFKVADNATCDSVITNQVDVRAKDAETNWAKAMINVKCGGNDKPECSDGKDNDGDGWFDYDDSCCAKTNGQSETCNNTKPQCSDGIDNDGDGWKDLDDSGCTDANDNDETNNTGGGNGLTTSISGTTTGRVGDMIFVNFTVTNTTGEGVWNVTSDFNYGNGIRVWTVPKGCQAKGANGFRCTIADLAKGASKTYTAKIKIDQCLQGSYGDFSSNATKPRQYGSNVSILNLTVDGCQTDKPQCSDGKDNDGDGWVDLDDSCCISANHDSEACTPGKPKITKTGPESVKPGDIATYIVRVTNTGTTKLTGLGAGDHFPAPYNTLFTYVPGQSSPECTQYVQDGLTVYGCGFFNLNASETKEFRFTYRVPVGAPCGVQVVDQADVSIPGGQGDWAKFMTLIKCDTPKPQCSDGIDNDGDGWVDLDDSGCDGPNDDDETNKPQCKDGKDNDGDGKIDHPQDPGCDSPTDNDEKDKPQCSDGKDNDGDGWVDLDDSGCDGPNDDDETNKPQCKDGKDNDGDGKIDHPADPGCDSPTDNDEKDTPQCSDGKDNDGDGWVDLDDSGCDGPNDDDETNKPQCKDGKDNDGDGKIDHPADPGCDSPTDNDEKDTPQCSDGKDNDGDGWVDLDDSGCDGPNDDDETNKPQCKDGKDNDGDGKIDHPQDPGCDSPTDNDETDKPQCKDGKDNDGDGKIDHPQDPGCDSPEDNDEWNNTTSPVMPVVDCVYNLGNGKYRAYFGYQNTGAQAVSIQAGSQTNGQMNIFAPGEANRGQVSLFEVGDKSAVFSVDFDGQALTWKVQPAGGDLRSVTASTSTKSCKPVKPIAECRDKKQGKFLTYFGYQNNNSFEVKLSIPEENKFQPSPEDRGQPKAFFPGRVVNAFSVNSDGDLTWKLGNETAAANTNLPLCTANAAPTCGSAGNYNVACGGNQTRIPLTSTASDPDGDTLTYKWSTDCTKATFSDPNIASPELIIDTSDGKAVNCGVWLVVNDGSNNPKTCDQAVKVATCNTDCKGTPNGSNKVDQCGVCGGNNECFDCNGVPNGGARVDQCGVCGGNNSCVDCAGTPNGSAKPDQCGVCNGNGKTCLQCTNTDITDKKLAVDVALNEQRGLILRLTNRLQNVSNNNAKFNKLITDSRKQAESLYLQGWRDIWTGIPNVSVNCNNANACTESDLSVSINAVSVSNTDLHGIAQNLIRQINGQRNKKDRQGAQNDKKLDQQSDNLFSSSQAVLQSIPRFNSVCN